MTSKSVSFPSLWPGTPLGYSSSHKDRYCTLEKSWEQNTKKQLVLSPTWNRYVLHFLWTPDPALHATSPFLSLLRPPRTFPLPKGMLIRQCILVSSPRTWRKIGAVSLAVILAKCLFAVSASNASRLVTRAEVVSAQQPLYNLFFIFFQDLFLFIWSTELQKEVEIDRERSSIH